MTQKQRSTGGLISLSIAAVLAIGGLSSLGIWQVHRLAWKRDLIHKIDTRVHARPSAAPAMAGADDAYLRIEAKGRFLHDRTKLVQAVTVRGAGYWVMTPLVTSQGMTLIVNRGFVPPEARRGYQRPTGIVQVVGLLRLSEPHGGFLRANDPATGRWYSRDVAALARAQKLASPVANYFLDAEAAPSLGVRPVGGLTVLNFPNSHLSYAITWFVLAGMVAGAYMLLMRHELNERRA